MKLIIQIPCYNEQDCILEVLKSIPKKIKGITKIKVFVIDDASCDNSRQIVEDYKVDKLIKLPKHQGLANVFMTGINACLEEDADIIVNLDGDNQYCACDIEKLIQPILENKCDISIGARPIEKIKSFGIFKKFFQKFGSYIVKLISNVDIKDAPSGFRAFSKKSALEINVFNDYTYTIETIIQAGVKNLRIQNVDINVNEQKNRKSKLFKNNFDYILKQSFNLIRFFIIYNPQKFFITIATGLFISALFIACRFLYFYFNNDGAGHVQSLILCSIIFILSFICFTNAIIGDLFSINRKLLEEIRLEQRLKKYKK